LRAGRLLQDRLFAHPKIAVRWNSEVDSIVGETNPAKVNGLVLKNRTDGTRDRLDVDGVFVAIGHKPNTSIFEGQLEMKNGYIRTRGGLDGMATATSAPGVFAAGDVQDHVYRQAVTSAGTGCMAALDALRYLEE